MNRSIAVAAALLAVCALFPSVALAEQWRWCAAGDVNDDGPPNGPLLVSFPFRVDGTPDHEAQYASHARSIMGTVRGEFLQTCSQPASSLQAATADRDNWFGSIAGLPMSTMDIDWAPGGVSHGANGFDTSEYDSTGRSGGRAYCIVQETVDGQPRALFSLVFSPPELQSDYDAAMGARFVRHVQDLYNAQPDAIATCHRNDTEAGAHSQRHHEAEMRRIKGWTIVMTHWSD